MRRTLSTVGRVIGYLEGTALSEQIVVTSGGVGYVVACPTPLPVGETVKLFVTTVVREDAITCYGFGDQLTQACFDAITKLHGVGPKHALAILGDLGAGGLARAVRDGDWAAIARPKGVGKATGEKLVASLKLPDAVFGIVDVDPPVPAAVTELIDALEDLGFARSRAEEAGRAAVAANPTGDEAAWLSDSMTRLRGAVAA